MRTRLQPSSPLRAGIDSRGGFAFSTGLSDAICEVVAGTDLTVGELELGPAVQRQLFIDLVNRPALYDAFLAGRGPVPLANRLEAEVAALLVPRAALTVLARPPALETAARLRRWVRRRPPASVGERHVLAAVVHPKLERFLEPVLAGVPVTFVDRFDGRPPRGASRPLRDYPRLLGAADRLTRELVETRARVAMAAEGNAPVDAVLAAVARRQGVPSVVLQQGFPAYVHAGFRGLPFDRMLVWGPGFAEALAPHNGSIDFEIVGDHMVEPAASGTREAVSVFFQGTSDLIAPAHLDELGELTIELAAAVPRVIVREHPSHPIDGALERRLSSLANVELAASGDVPLAAVLNASAAAVSIYSTTLLEAVPAGGVPVSFNPTSLPGLTPGLKSVGYEVRDRSAALSAVLAVLAGERFDTSEFVARYFPLLGAEAAAFARSRILAS